jgi:hypothetical protein
MIVVRDVFQAKYGKGGELVKLLKEAQTLMPAGFSRRVLTDASGQFFTIVTETQVANLLGKWFAQMQPLVEVPR